MSAHLYIDLYNGEDTILQKIKGYPYLYLNNGYYYVRITIPKALAHYFEKYQYKRSLQTQDFKEARLKCWQIGHAALLFFKDVRKLSMNLTEDKVKEIVRNHFEKRLLDASEDLIFDTVLVRTDPTNGEPVANGFNPKVIENEINFTKQDLERYEHYRKTFDSGDEQRNIAKTILDDFGYEYKEGESNFQKLCLDLVRAQYEAARIKLAHLQREDHEGVIRDPYFEGCRNFYEKPDPTLYFEYMRKPYYKDHKKATLGDAVTDYISYRLKEDRLTKRNTNTTNEYEGYFNRLIDIWGADKDMAAITTQDCLTLKGYLMSYPKNYVSKYQSKGIALLSLLNDKSAEYDILGQAQSAKMWGAYRGFFAWAEEQEILLSNPFNGISFPIKKHSTDDKDPFSEEQLITFFNSPIYTGRKHRKKAFWIPADKGGKGFIIKDGYYWVPLVALFSGMRAGEILGLKIEDVHYNYDTYYFDLGGLLKLKTGQSKRYVPVHPELLKIGFVPFYETRKSSAKNTEYLFNNIPRPDPTRITNKYSNKFSKYITEIGIKTDKTSFHSFRHTFIDALRDQDADISERVQFALCGHSSDQTKNITNYKYGSGHKIKDLMKELSKVQYPFLDLSHLYED